MRSGRQLFAGAALLFSPKAGAEVYQIAGYSRRIGSRHDGLFQIIPQHRNYAERFDRIEIVHDLARALERILGFEFIGYRSAINQRVVEKLLPRVAIERTNVIGGGQAQTLIRLRHQIADVNLGGRRIHDGIGNSMHQQVWDEAGEQGTGADADNIRACDRVQRLRERIDIGRNQKKFLNAHFAGRDFGFATNASAVFHQRFQFDVGSGRRVNVAASDQNFRRQSNRLGEV